MVLMLANLAQKLTSRRSAPGAGGASFIASRSGVTPLAGARMVNCRRMVASVAPLRPLRADKSARSLAPGPLARRRPNVTGSLVRRHSRKRRPTSKSPQ